MSEGAAGNLLPMADRAAARLIGTVVGAVPGVGGVVASFLSYSLVRWQAAPESEKASFSGTATSKASPSRRKPRSTYKDCSALIPTLAFGLPAGRVEMAVFMGILIVHGCSRAWHR